ncbi:MAG: hypothetical protein LC114_10220 [Bryobacterales bacterium]|nr:hypothetical protein [Bryobacterales bacterium]
MVNSFQFTRSARLSLVFHEIAEGVKQGNLSVLHKAKTQLDEMIPRVRQVLRQTRERVLRDNTRADGKLVSIFETHTEVIRKGKTNKPNEFGKLVVVQEAENQIITHYEVCEQRPADATLLVTMERPTPLARL